MQNLQKGLYIIATPIGNLDDISFRAKEILNISDFIICENPIHSLKLLNKLGIKKKLFSLHDHNENSLINKIQNKQNNSIISLISDAGSPLISDPGYKLVADYIKKNIYITSIPGACSIIPALQLSGIPINNFAFFGFVPKNTAAIKNLIEKVLNINLTSILFISGKKLLNFLKILEEMNCERWLSISKEITKKNERTYRGNIGNIYKNISSNSINVKGEFIIIIGSNDKKSTKNLGIAIETQIEKLLKKYSLTEVVEIVHKLTSISKREIYKKTLIIKND